MAQWRRFRPFAGPRSSGKGRPFPDIPARRMKRDSRNAGLFRKTQYDKVLFILGPSEQAKAATGKRVTIVEYPDGRISRSVTEVSSRLTAPSFTSWRRLACLVKTVKQLSRPKRASIALIASARPTAAFGPATQLFVADHRRYWSQPFVVSDGALIAGADLVEGRAHQIDENTNDTSRETWPAGPSPLQRT
jgi:hypothetical protein